MQLPLLHTLVERVGLPGVLDIVLVGLAAILGVSFGPTEQVQDVCFH